MTYLGSEETLRITTAKGSLEVGHMFQVDWALMLAILAFVLFSRPHF